MKNTIEQITHLTKRKGAIRLLASAIAGALLFLTAPGLAQAAASPGPTAGGQSKTLWEQIKEGGWVMIKKMGSSIYARNGSVRKPDQPAALRRNKPTNPIAISSTPNVQTMAAPEGRSHWNERNNPATPPSRAMTHPIRRRVVKDRARLIPQTAGTIR